jgi:hypothetical protein
MLVDFVFGIDERIFLGGTNLETGGKPRHMVIISDDITLLFKEWDVVIPSIPPDIEAADDMITQGNRRFVFSIKTRKNAQSKTIGEVSRVQVTQQAAAPTWYHITLWGSESLGGKLTRVLFEESENVFFRPLGERGNLAEAFVEDRSFYTRASAFVVSVEWS